jgi:proteasome lid subunit RPN8/RPN11
MMAEIPLELPPRVYKAIMAHLLPDDTLKEQAAFAFAACDLTKNQTSMRFLEWEPIRPGDFTHHSEFHLELGDEKRSEIIKRAHNLNASIVEWHSHPLFWPAEFSLSDMAGLGEFVPQVMWRLKGRPYAAVVVTPYDFDALVWTERQREPIQSLVLRVGLKKLNPTRRTLMVKGGYCERKAR